MQQREGVRCAAIVYYSAYCIVYNIYSKYILEKAKIKKESQEVERTMYILVHKQYIFPCLQLKKWLKQHTCNTVQSTYLLKGTQSRDILLNKTIWVSDLQAKVFFEFGFNFA